jgi:large subunit ribosomal protein L17
MRKRNQGRKFGRETSQRQAMFRLIARAIFLHGKIETTEAKAKEARMIVEKMITKAKAGGLANTRALARDLSQDVVKKLITEIAPKYKDRNGGYTRIIKLGPRKADAADMAIFELV